MFGKMFLVFSAMVFGAQCRYVYPEMEYVPGHYERVRRQAQGSVTFNSDGTSGAAVRVPLTPVGDKNILSAIGSADLTRNQNLASSSLGLALDNVNGHSASVMKTRIPGFGDQLTAAGKVNVFHNDNHDLNAKAFATKNMPDIPQLPNFNTVGAGVDYMFKDRVGASASAAHTDFFNRNDYSLGGKLNLFRNHDTSLDFNAAFKKFDADYMKSGWDPNFEFSFSKYF